MYKCTHFKIYELVDPVTYNKYGQRAWQFLDPKALMLIDKLREVFGSCTINNWKWNGSYKWSGLRTPSCIIGASMSQHRFGRAFDLKFKNISAPEVRKAIKEDAGYWEAQGLCGMENKTPTWVHIDTRNVDPIKFFNP